MLVHHPAQPPPDPDLKHTHTYKEKETQVVNYQPSPNLYFDIIASKSFVYDDLVLLKM